MCVTYLGYGRGLGANRESNMVHGGGSLRILEKICCTLTCFDTKPWTKMAPLASLGFINMCFPRLVIFECKKNGYSGWKTRKWRMSMPADIYKLERCARGKVNLKTVCFEYVGLTFFCCLLLLFQFTGKLVTLLNYCDILHSCPWPCVRGCSKQSLGYYASRSRPLSLLIMRKGRQKRHLGL